MFYHIIYAQILDKKVKNIIVCNDIEMANILARNTYGQDAIAVECTYWACAIGDTYENNKFISPKGEEREYKGSEAENIEKLEIENTQLNRQVSEDNETMLDMAYELDTVKDDNAELNEIVLQHDYDIEILKDKVEV